LTLRNVTRTLPATSFLGSRKHRYRGVQSVSVAAACLWSTRSLVSSPRAGE